MNSKKAIIFSFLLLQLSFAAVLAEDQGVYDYDNVATNLFWNSLYPTGGWTLYCGYRFDSSRKSQNGKVMVIDHIYATEWIVDQLKCGSRLQCYERDNQNFKRMEADMHNMYPVWQSLVIFRNGHPFGEITGEDWRFDDCDFEWNADVVEPRSLAQGNIARAIFYMHAKYRLPIEPGMLKILKNWNRNDPPSKQEKERNDVIEKIQGQRNPYIDNPSLANRIQTGSR